MHGWSTSNANAQIGSKSDFQAKVKEKYPLVNELFTSCLFKQLCYDINSDYETLLFYTAVRWLSKGKFVTRFFELKFKLMLFLEMEKKSRLTSSTILMTKHGCKV